MANEIVLAEDALNASVDAVVDLVDAGSGAGLCNVYSVAVACVATNATNLFTDVAHGLENNDRVRMKGTALPAELDTETIHHIVNKTADTFQVALTQGGAAVTFTDDGTSVTYCPLLVKIELNDPAYGDSSGGVAALDATPEPEDTPILAGTAENADMVDSDDNIIFSGKCDTSGALVNFNSLEIVTEVNAKITSGSYTQAAGTL